MRPLTHDKPVISEGQPQVAVAKLTALAEEDPGIANPLSGWAITLLRVVVAAGERLDHDRPLAPIHVDAIEATICELASNSDEEHQSLLGIALVHVFWGVKLLEDPRREPDLLTAIASLKLVACRLSSDNHHKPLPLFIKHLKAEVKTLRMGPGWHRRVKGLEVMSLKEVPARSIGTSESESDAKLDLEIRLGRLERSAPKRERQLLEALRSDPTATSPELAAALGITPSTARTLLERLRRRAKVV